MSRASKLRSHSPSSTAKVPVMVIAFSARRMRSALAPNPCPFYTTSRTRVAEQPCARPVTWTQTCKVAESDSGSWPGARGTSRGATAGRFSRLPLKGRFSWVLCDLSVDRGLSRPTDARLHATSRATELPGLVWPLRRGQVVTSTSVLVRPGSPGA
jgi:hypothetical protein